MHCCLPVEAAFQLKTRGDAYLSQTPLFIESLSTLTTPLVVEVLYTLAKQRERETSNAIQWMEQGGNKQAVGHYWSLSLVPLLPPGCQTETEVSCQSTNTPVHQCLMLAE